MSLYEAVLQFLGPAMVAWSPGEPPRSADGQSDPGGDAPQRVPHRDERWVVISGPTDAQVLRILELMGADTDEHRARFGRASERNAHADELDGWWHVGSRTRTRTHVVGALVAERDPRHRGQRSSRACSRTPMCVRGGSIATIDDPELGTLHMPAPAPRLSRTPAAIVTPGPPLGADTDAVLRDWLGDGPEEA